MREETGRVNRSIPGSKPGVTSRTSEVFWSWVALQDTGPAGNRPGTLVSKGKNYFCTGVSRAHWKTFKLDVKGERDRNKLTGDNPGGGSSMAVGWCASKVLQSAIPVEALDGKPCNRKDKGYWHVRNHRSSWEWPLRKVKGSLAQRKCSYTNAHSTGNKQEEL